MSYRKSDGMEEDPMVAALHISMSLDGMENNLQFNHPSSLISVNGPSMTGISNEFLLLTAKLFETREDLISVVRKIGFSQGYVVVIKRSKKSKAGDSHYVLLGCDRGGSYRTFSTLEEKTKNSASRLIDCLFKIVGRSTAEGLWKVEIISLMHNHVPSTDMAGHPYSRRFTKEEAMQVEQMSKAGIKPRQILSSLRQSNPNLLAVSRNIYSKKSDLRNESLGGRSVIQALLEELGGAGFYHNIKYDQSGHLTHLFFAHPTSIELTKSYSSVFVMDCTYKTNKYKMPLLEIIGVTSFNTSFYLCFVFMQKEEQEDYQ